MSYRSIPSLLILLFFTSQMADAQIALSKTKVSKDITVYVPEQFIPMSRTELISRFVSSRTPLAMFTSNDLLIDFGINETVTMWQENDMKILQRFYKANILNLFTEVEFLREEIAEVNGRQYVIFEFVSKITDDGNVFGGGSSTSKFTHIRYTVHNDKVLLFNFTCPKRLQARWQPVATEMMNKIKVKP